MFEDALRYPREGDGVVERIAIGGVLGILSPLVVPALALFGYLIRVIESVDAGDDHVPPPFEDWEGLIVDGLKAAVIGIAYGLVPSVIFTLAVLAFLLPVATSDGPTGWVAGALGLVVGLVVILLAAIVSLAFAYVLPAGLVAFARTGRLDAAFSLATIRRIATHGDYAAAWLVAFVISVGADVIAGLLVLTTVGAVLVPFLAFYGAVASAYAIGGGVRDASLPDR